MRKPLLIRRVQIGPPNIFTQDQRGMFSPSRPMFKPECLLEDNTPTAQQNTHEWCVVFYIETLLHKNARLYCAGDSMSYLEANLVLAEVPRFSFFLSNFRFQGPHGCRKLGDFGARGLASALDSTA